MKTKHAVILRTTKLHRSAVTKFQPYLITLFVNSIRVVVSHALRVSYNYRAVVY